MGLGWPVSSEKWKAPLDRQVDRQGTANLSDTPPSRENDYVSNINGRT